MVHAYYVSKNVYKNSMAKADTHFRKHGFETAGLKNKTYQTIKINVL